MSNNVADLFNVRSHNPSFFSVGVPLHTITADIRKNFRLNVGEIVRVLLTCLG